MRVGLGKQSVDSSEGEATDLHWVTCICDFVPMQDRRSLRVDMAVDSKKADIVTRRANVAEKCRVSRSAVL